MSARTKPTNETAFANRVTKGKRSDASGVVGGLTSSTMLSLFRVPVMFLSIAKEQAVPVIRDQLAAKCPAPNG